MTASRQSRHRLVGSSSSENDKSDDSNSSVSERSHARRSDEESTSAEDDSEADSRGSGDEEEEGERRRGKVRPDARHDSLDSKQATDIEARFVVVEPAPESAAPDSARRRSARRSRTGVLALSPIAGSGITFCFGGG